VAEIGKSDCGGTGGKKSAAVHGGRVADQHGLSMRRNGLSGAAMRCIAETDEHALLCFSITIRIFTLGYFCGGCLYEF
jgi:hypothetical protein